MAKTAAYLEVVMQEMPYEIIITQCHQVLAALRPQLPANLSQFADELIQHGEWGLALEFLIDWIGELDLSITPQQMHALETAMTAMNLQDSARMRWLRMYFRAQ